MTIARLACTDPVILNQWHVISALDEIGVGVVNETLLLDERIGFTATPDGECRAWRSSGGPPAGVPIDGADLDRVDRLPVKPQYGYLWTSGRHGHLRPRSRTGIGATGAMIEPAERVVLRSHWHPVARSDAIDDGPVGVVLLGRPLVVFRSGGRACAASDRCPHRGSPLSLGSYHDDCLVCPYHGLRYSADGQCAGFPAGEVALPTDTFSIAYRRLWKSLCSS